MPRLKSNHIELYYEVCGAGQPLVFIHGLGASCRDWEAQVQHLCKTHQVITLDLRGHGRSDKPDGPYDVPMFVRDIIGLFDSLHIGPAHIVGWSLGGVIGFQFTLDFPIQVQTLTIINSVPTFGDPVLFQQEIERRIGIVRQFGMRAMGQALSEILFPKPEHAHLRESFVDRWAENDPRAYIEATRSGQGWSVIDRLSEIHCPTLIISADHDYWPVTDQQAWAKRIPNGRFEVIPDSHHAVVIEHPDKLNAVLSQFLFAHSGFNS
jgi:pimeloyl-ACP methyl ester carboxylesterase